MVGQSILNQLSEKSKIKLQPQQASQFPFPPGCPVVRIDQTSGLPGKVKSVYVSFETVLGSCKTQYEVVSIDSGGKLTVQMLLSEQMRYATSCPVTILAQSTDGESCKKKDLNGFVEGFEPHPLNDVKFSYTVKVMTSTGNDNGGCYRRFSISPSSLKYNDISGGKSAFDKSAESEDMGDNFGSNLYISVYDQVHENNSSTRSNYTEKSQKIFPHSSSRALDLKRRKVPNSCATVLNSPSMCDEVYSVTSVKENDVIPTLSGKYAQLTTEHYLLMAFLQSAFLASSVDIATQVMAGASPIDFGHVAALAIVASTFSGAINALWLQQLEQAFPGTATKDVAIKTLIHVFILCAIINSAYLIGVPLLRIYFSLHHGILPSPQMVDFSRFKGWNLEEFITLTKIDAVLFIPYNTIAFKYIPPQVRPLTHATMTAIFNVALSAITLGYFNRWCERLLSVLPVF